ncbi:hypothetical protein [endosymbiont GvMRE of Glomus versiforme]|uniref:hypothetical protein n=1 Tax=endosymbiont GvMRE of Glomus versiforme TaxID=2039283 RepID=UPI000ED00DD8|nr:hypothetical protein [endosymbiont GvMRE of Glomus versiforme]RHZ36524.1 ATP-dependent endonuclease [endosymbiont GvMRE of Glomus versiforme]
MRENGASEREVSINIKNFRNLKNLRFKFLEGKMNIILGKNNVGKSNLLDYINSWYTKNNKNSAYEIFYLKENEKFAKYLSSPIIFEIKKVLLRSIKEKEGFFECNEHYFFEIESQIFGIKRNIVLTRCHRSSLLPCSIKDYRELQLNKGESNYLGSPILIAELEKIIKEGIFFLFDEILKNVKVLSSQRFYGLGELLTYEKGNKLGNFCFKFKFSFLDPWDGKKKPLGLGTEKIIFLNLLLNILQNKEKLLVFLDTKENRKWRHKNWVFFFLPSSRQKSILLIDKPETFLHPGYERELFLSLKRLTEERNNCDVIIATNSSEFLVSFSSEVYDGNLSVVILNQLGLDLQVKIVYLKEIIDRIKIPILESCAEYGNLFKQKLKKPDKFYRNKWIEILSKEYTSKLFFSKKVLFVEGSTEIVFFSYFVFDLLLKGLKEKNIKQLEEIDKIVEEISLLKEKSEEETLRSVWVKQRRDEFNSHYVKFIDERKFWEKFKEVRIVPIFGKLNYIFFAKLSESLWLEHKFLLDNDKKSVDKKDIKMPEEKVKWEKLHEINKGIKKEQIKSWEEHEYRTTLQEAQKALNEGWLWPNHKFFYDSTTYCKTNKKNKCYCENITWIEEEFEKFIGLEKSKEFGWKNPEINLIEQIDTIIKNLIDSKEATSIREEKWRIIFNLILEEWKWGSYGFCKGKEIQKYRNE